MTSGQCLIIWDFCVPWNDRKLMKFYKPTPKTEKNPVCLMNKVFKNQRTFIGMGNLVPYLVLLDDPIGCLGNFPGDSDRGRFHLT